MAKQRNPPTDRFCAVIQADYRNQMDVLRWLQHDPYYTVIIALHASDVYDADDFPAGETARVRDNGDGTQSEFRAGDAKPAHYHIIVKTATKIRAESLTKRFCGQVHFQALSDTQEYARYLTHGTFAARHKAQYDSMDIIRPLTGDRAWRWYCDLTATHDSDDICAIVEQWCDMTDHMSARDACLALAGNRQTKALASVMAHGYFYDKILRKGG